MKRYEILVIAMAAILLMSSCARELTGTTTDGVGTPVRFSVQAGQLKNTDGTPVTRSTDVSTVNETEISDLWVVQFGSDGSYLTKVYLPTVTATAFDVALTPGANTHIYFLANWGSSAFSSFSGTESTFQTTTKVLVSESDIFYSGATASGKKDLPMTSVARKFTVPTSGFADMSASPVTMNYAVARLNVYYNATVSNFALSRIRICNIPTTMQYVAPAAGTNTPATLTSSSVFNTSYTDVSSNSNVSGTPITFYVPENMRGQTSATTEKDKTGISGDYPTYVDLVGYSTNATDGWGELHYRIYPGVDVIRDYNVTRSTQYVITGNLTGISQADGRVSDQPKLSNCYILAPGQTVYIPVKRANQTAELRTQITDVTNTSLLPYNYWQTAPGLVNVSMDNRSGCLKVTASSTATTAGITGGDAIVGVTTGTGTAPSALWSWHVWVTSYDPNATAQTLNSLVWMDRNLGAMAACTGSNTFDQCGGLYYQWGRKDPFPGVTSTGTEASNYYNGSTTATVGLTNVVDAASTGVGTTAPNYNLPLTVQKPTIFITSNAGAADWYASGSTAQNNNLWGTTKTVYDPCPSGWKVPKDGSWTSTGWTLPSSTASNTNYGTWVSGGTAYYPVPGYRNFTTGLMTNGGTYGHYWMASVNGTYGVIMNLSNWNFTTSGINNRALCLSVRCVKE